MHDTRTRYIWYFYSSFLSSFLPSFLPSFLSFSLNYLLLPPCCPLLLDKFDVKTIARANILALEPYRCARDDYSNGVLLDANENAFGPGLNAKSEEKKMDLHRYPDPLHLDIKAKVTSFTFAIAIRYCYFNYLTIHTHYWSKCIHLIPYTITCSVL